MKKALKTLVLIGSVILLTGCGGVKLENGENAIVSFDEGGISAQEFYDLLKTTYGQDQIANTIDKYLLDKKYEETSNERSYIKQSVSSAKDAAEKYNTDIDTYVHYYYNVADEAAFKDYISLNYKRSLWIQDYGEETVTDTQIQEYYDTESVGDMTLSHILITSTATDSMTDDEKTEAKSTALATAKEVISKLDEGSDFAELAKEYSKDDNTASNGGSLGKVNTGDYDDTVIDAAKALEVGSYTLTPVESQYGYHIIYKTAQEDKPELDDTLKSDIRTIIGKEIASDTAFYSTAMKALREKAGMKFEDSELETAYNKSIGN